MLGKLWLSRYTEQRGKEGARASLMILRVGYEDHPMKVKVMVELYNKLGTWNISSHTWWTEIACSLPAVIRRSGPGGPSTTPWWGPTCPAH